MEQTSPIIRLQTALEVASIQCQEHYPETYKTQEYFFQKAQGNLQALASRINNENATASIAAKRAGEEYNPLSHF